MPTSAAQTKVREHFVIPVGLAKFIFNHVDKEAFYRWSAHCSLEGEGIKKAYHINLNKRKDEDNNKMRDELFAVLAKAELMRDTKEKVYFVAIKMLIPSQKCGYVRGKKRATLDKIQNDNNIRAFMDNGQTDPIPEGFGRLILSGPEVAGLRGAWQEVKRLVDISLPFNPFGPAEGVKVVAVQEGGGRIRERIKIPRPSKLSAEQRQQFENIKVTSEVNFYFDQVEKPEDGRFVTLEGSVENIVSVKKRIAKLIGEIESPSRARLEMLVPYPTHIEMIGPGGENIKALKIKLGIGMCFLGSNYDIFAEGRVLRLSANSEETVNAAKEYLDRVYIQQKGRPMMRSIEYGAHHNVISEEESDIDGEEKREEEEEEDQAQMQRSQDEEEDIVQVEMGVRFGVCTTANMDRIKSKSGLLVYHYRTAKNGVRPVVLRGTKLAVQRAQTMLDRLMLSAEEMNTNNQSRPASLSPFAMTTEDEEEEKEKRGKEEQQMEGMTAKQLEGAKRGTGQRAVTWAQNEEQEEQLNNTSSSNISKEEEEEDYQEEEQQQEQQKAYGEYKEEDSNKSDRFRQTSPAFTFDKMQKNNSGDDGSGDEGQQTNLPGDQEVPGTPTQLQRGPPTAAINGPNNSNKEEEEMPSEGEEEEVASEREEEEGGRAEKEEGEEVDKDFAGEAEEQIDVDEEEEEEKQEETEECIDEEEEEEEDENTGSIIFSNCQGIAEMGAQYKKVTNCIVRKWAEREEHWKKMLREREVEIDQLRKALEEVKQQMAGKQANNGKVSV